MKRRTLIKRLGMAVPGMWLGRQLQADTLLLQPSAIAIVLKITRAATEN